MKMRCFCCKADNLSRGRRVKVGIWIELSKEQFDHFTDTQKRHYCEQCEMRPGIVCEACYIKLNDSDVHVAEINNKKYRMAAVPKQGAPIYTAERYAEFIERKMFDISGGPKRKKRSEVFSAISHLLTKTTGDKIRAEFPELLEASTTCDPDILLRLAACAVWLVQNQPDMK